MCPAAMLSRARSAHGPWVIIFDAEGVEQVKIQDPSESWGLRVGDRLRVAANQVFELRRIEDVVPTLPSLGAVPVLVVACVVPDPEP